MGVFDYERLNETIKVFEYATFDYPSGFDKSSILTNSYDGIVYEQKAIEVITGFDGSYNPVRRTKYVYNAVVDLHNVTEEKAKTILSNNGNSSFAYRTKNKMTKTSSVGNMSQFYSLAKNTNLILPIARAFHKTFPDYILNQNIFKITKLREDIIFINARVEQPEKNPIDTLIGVNSHSFWKRFTIKKYDSDTETYSDVSQATYDYSAEELIDEIYKNPSDYLVRINYIGDEMKNTIAYYGETKTYDDVKDDSKFIISEVSVVEFTGYVRYNKRTWLELLSSKTGISYKDTADIPTIDSYKIEGSNTYYPGDESEICMTYRS